MFAIPVQIEHHYCCIVSLTSQCFASEYLLLFLSAKKFIRVITYNVIVLSSNNNNTVRLLSPSHHPVMKTITGMTKMVTGVAAVGMEVRGDPAVWYAYIVQISCTSQQNYL